MDTQTSEPVPPARSHRRRRLEIILLVVFLVATLFVSAVVVAELRWRWRRFMVDWS